MLLAIVMGGQTAVASTGLSNGSNDDGTWLIKVDPQKDPQAVAESVGADYVGPVSAVPGYHRVRYYEQLSTALAPEVVKQGIRETLAVVPSIETFEENTVPKLYPREFDPPDPRFPEQWHLENRGQSGGIPFADLNVRSVWDAGTTGQGVVVGVVDTGIQFSHPDLSPNWLIGQGYDYLGNDSNPSPAADNDRHGTAVAGITLAASNDLGVIGIAHQAQLVPLRMIAYDDTIGGATLSEVADSLSHISWPQVDVFNNSWGPSDNQGVRYAEIGSIVQESITNGTINGRGGLGTIYVWAAGNGGLDDDNSNFDGYNSLPYTISVGAVGHDDVRANYSEVGANLLVSAPSQGRGPGILTTDNTGSSGYAQGDEFSNFNGTSAAAPMVTGVVALMLDRRPDLGWMDVQQILAKSASPVDFSDENWLRNGAGHWVSHEYGFGRVDARAAVTLSEQWSKLGPLQTTAGSQSRFRTLFQNQVEQGSIFINSEIKVHSVRVTVDFNHTNWGDLRIELISPDGTRSVLQEPHFNFSNPMPDEWTFLSTHFLDEDASGAWRLEVTDSGSAGTGSWIDWRIAIMGNANDPSNSAPFDEVDRDYLEIVSAAYPLLIDAFDRLVDPDGDPLEVISVQHPTAGTLADLGDGFFEYVMGAPKYGIDTFSVLVGDGKGGAVRQLVKVINPLPIVQNDLYAITKGSSVRLPVLDNDHDGDGDPLRIISVDGEFAEYATINSDGTIQFSPPVDLLGVVRLSYHVTDDVDGQSEGQIALVIQDSADVAIKFDGVDDFMRVAPTTSLVMSDNITAEAWIYPESFGEHVTGFGRIYDRDTFIFFINGFDHEFYNDRSLVLYVQTPDGTYAANSVPNTIELNKWQHVAVSYQGSNGSSPIKMYVDGQQVGLVNISFPELGSLVPQGALLDNRAEPLYMGEAPSGARAFKGSMSEFRIWSRILSSTEINSRHDVRLLGNEPGLHLYLPLNRRLDFLADSIGSYSGSATVFEAQRVPMELPWAEFVQHYSIVTDAGTGWWRDEALGWLYGDYFPWVFAENFGWIWTGHTSDSETYSLYFMDGDRGWMQTSTELYPWFHYAEEERWLWHRSGSAWPARFYDPASGAWE